MNSSEDPKTIPTSEPTIDSLSSVGITIEQLKNENTVRTRFPKYFNPLFRKQGIVNKFIIFAIESLSGFLGELNGRLGELNGRLGELNGRHGELNGRVLQNTERFQRLEKQIEAQHLKRQKEFIELKHNSDAIISTLMLIDRTQKNSNQKIDTLEKDYIKLSTRIESHKKAQEKSAQLLTEIISNQEEGLHKFKDAALKKTTEEIGQAENRIREKYEEDIHNHKLNLQELNLQVNNASNTQQDILKDVHNNQLNLQELNLQTDNTSNTQQGILKDVQNYALNLQSINRHLDEVGHIQNLRIQKEKQFKESFDPFYRAFEDQYRGSRDVIIERLKEYKDYISEAASHCGLKTNNAKKPVALDLGCGRGEWLELLMNCKISACGVDTNEAFVADCKKAGYNVTLGDALEELTKNENGSLAIISGFHIVEHIDIGYLLQLFKESYRTLAKGGILIFETPNPENLLVSTQTFYLDPTHKNPIPPNLLEFCAVYYGFKRVNRKPSSPYSEDDLIPGRGPTNTKLNELLYGPQDYAIIAYKL